MMAIQLPFDAIVEVSGYSELLRGSGNFRGPSPNFVDHRNTDEHGIHRYI